MSRTGAPRWPYLLACAAPGRVECCRRCDDGAVVHGHMAHARIDLLQQAVHCEDQALVAALGLDGRGPDSIGNIQSSIPGEVFDNLVIVGTATGEGYMSPPGDIRAYDVVTGRLVWTFHTVPRPGEFGYDTWPKEAWKSP